MKEIEYEEVIRLAWRCPECRFVNNEAAKPFDTTIATCGCCYGRFVLVRKTHAQMPIYQVKHVKMNGCY